MVNLFGENMVVKTVDGRMDTLSTGDADIKNDNRLHQTTSHDTSKE